MTNGRHSAGERAKSAHLSMTVAIAAALVAAPHARAEPLEARKALSRTAACAIADHPRRHAGQALVLEGSYEWDWEWGAFLKFKGCKTPLRAPRNDLIERRISARAIRQGSARVIFTGNIIQAKTCNWQGNPVPASRCDYFDVKQVDAFELLGG